MIVTSASLQVFQRRINGSVDFYRNWTEYENGFGDPNAEFWIGTTPLRCCCLHVLNADDVLDINVGDATVLSYEKRRSN